MSFISRCGEGVRRFSDRHPLFMAALVTVCGVIAADYSWIAGVLVVIAISGLGWFAAGRGKGITWLLCGLLSVLVFSVRNENRQEAERTLVGTGGRYEAVALNDARGTTWRWSVPVRLTTDPWRGVKVQWEGSGRMPVAGARISGAGNFIKLREPRNPEEFDEAKWLRRKGMIATFRGQDLHVEIGRLAAFGASIRSGFRTAVSAGLEEDSIQAKVIRAIVIGESPMDADEVVAAFRNSGTLHIFSVSGMHVVMVGAIAWAVLRVLRVSRRHAVPILVALAFGYAWITGNSPPAVRSAWMMAVFLMAFSFRRQPDSLNALGAVLLAAMLWDGNLLFQPGVQLSYGVVAAIGLGIAWTSRWFAWIGKKEEYLPEELITGWRAWGLKKRRQLATSLSVSSAAWLGSTPLTIWHFGLVTPVALIGTLALAWPVTFMLALALISATVHPFFPESAVWVNRANAKLADVCVLFAKGLSAIPGSHLSTRHPREPMLLIYDLDYGASAACFSGGKEGAVLLNCGDPRGFRYRVVKSLRGLGIEPDSVVVSQPDGGSLGGASQVWEAFPIRQVWMPVDKARSPAFRAWIKDGPQAGVKIIKPEQINVLPLPDGARLEILHVPDSHAQNARAADRAAVFRLHWRGWKFLFTGDAGVTTENQMLASGKDLSADVIIAGRHPLGATLGARFLQAVHPQVIIAAHSDYPASEKLEPEQVAFWESLGISVLNQGETGGVTLRMDSNGDLLLEGYVDGSVTRLTRH